ncbi:MAG: protein kinase [Gemmatimonadales bacterium]
MSDLLSRARAALADQYDVVREIGRGGMATVFLANDKKHGRAVALKLLKPDIAASLGVERFHREIRLAAKLQHPHILALYDSGAVGDLVYFVMPFVEGESARQRLVREGELPIADALRLVREVADALAYAHQHGVVHRDIKPDNILLSGKHAVVTDFGVAKAVSEAAGEDGLTTAGIALGTPHYMAPEQAAADPHVDHRADIYALGCVAYELLTGEPPITGNTAQAILAGQVSKDPTPLGQKRDVSPGIEAAVMRCLAKRPADRWQSAEELLRELETVTTPTGGTTPTDTRPIRIAPTLATRRMPLMLGGSVVALVLVAWFMLGRGESNPAFTVSDLRQVTREPSGEFSPAVAPDGRDVAYTAGVGSVAQRLYLRDLGGGRPIAINPELPPPHLMPRWTPDGRELGFTAGPNARDWVMYLMPRLGGAARALGPGALWDMHGDRMAFTRAETLFVAGLDSRERTMLATGEAHSAVFSPDGRQLAWVQGNFNYLLSGNPGNVAPSRIVIGSADGGAPVTVVDDGRINVNPLWTPDGGHLLWISDRDGSRDIHVQAVDRRGRPRGASVRLTTGFEPLTMSMDQAGTIVTTRYRARRNIWAVDLPASGPAVSVSTGRAVTQGSQLIENHGLSRDGRWLAFDAHIEGSEDIYVTPADGSGEPRRVTRHPANEFHPDFSPDGTELAFHSPREGSRDIYTVRLDGTGEVRVTELSGEEYHPTFSPDGLHIAFAYGLVQGKRSLWVVSRSAVGAAWGTPRLLGDSIANEAAWLLDGRLVVRDDRTVRIVTLDGVATVMPTPGIVALQNVSTSSAGVIYIQGTDARGAEGVWEVRRPGDRPRSVIWFDDPGKDIAFVITSGVGKVYLTMAEPEADVWAMRLVVP